MLVTENLYHNIIEKEAPDFNELKIISGYGSSEFLANITSKYPHLKISLFLGMTQTNLGISKKNHDEFKKITELNNNILVYYQINGVPTHMKIVEFCLGETKKSYVGSANFTENGFINNRELMTLITDSTKELFCEQMKVSLLCTDETIDEHIFFYSENEGTMESLIQEESSNYSDEIKNKKLENPQGLRYTESDIVFKFRNVRSTRNFSFFNIFEIEIVLNQINNPRWYDSGINSWVNGTTPSLLQTPKVFFDKIFPVGEIFEIIADDGQIYDAKLTGRFNKNLELINGNFYEYVRKRIGLNEKRPISREDLEIYGKTKVCFERIDELKYLMSFNLYDSM